MIENHKIPSTCGNVSATIHCPVVITNKLAILCPGYCDSKDYSGFLKHACSLAEIGYTAVRFDPTGTWESDGDIADYTTTQYLADIKNVIEYMLAMVNYTHITLIGHGRGGIVSSFYTAQDSRLSELVCIMPSSDRSMKYKRDEAWKINGYELVTRDLPSDRKETREFRVLYSHLEDFMSYDIKSYVSKVTVPVYLFSGDLDLVVPMKDVEILYDMFVFSFSRTRTVITGVIHDYRLHDSQIEQVDRSLMICLR